jgi:hypothetical protein
MLRSSSPSRSLPDYGQPTYVQETKKLILPLIKRLRLTDELLRRPTFGFVHQIVLEVVKSTGFAAGLFTAAESDADLVTQSRDLKLSFIGKLISCIHFIMNDADSDISANKVLAGLEPEKTHLLLQSLALACRKPREVIQASIDRVLSGERVHRVFVPSTPVQTRPSTPASSRTVGNSPFARVSQARASGVIHPSRTSTPRKSFTRMPKETRDGRFSSIGSAENVRNNENEGSRGLRALLDDHHPMSREPSVTSDPLCSVARLLLWRSKTSILSVPSAAAALGKY